MQSWRSPGAIADRSGRQQRSARRPDPGRGVVGLVRRGSRRLRRALPPRDQSDHLRRGLDPVRTDRRARGSPSLGRLPTACPPVGGGVPGRQVLRPLPAPARRPPIPPAGFLRRRACRGRRPRAAHSRCRALPHVLSGARDRRSLAADTPSSDQPDPIGSTRFSGSPRT